MSAAGAAVPRFAPGAVDAAATAFRRDGALVFDGLWPEPRIAQARDALAETLPLAVGTTFCRSDQTHTVSKRRAINPIPIDSRFDCRDLLLQADLVALFDRALGDEWVYEAVGVISSYPGADDQAIHRDGQPLFGHSGLDRVIPAYAITLAIPLQPIGAAFGYTGIWPGSHALAEDPAPENEATPEVPLGSCLVWNFLVHHRGLRNPSDHTRPMLYATACRPFWTDATNFERGRERKLLLSRALHAAMTETERARFARADLVD